MVKEAVPKFIYVKTQDELWQELLEQFDALQTHGASYDAGKIWQAKTLATTVYTLLKDSGQNKWVRPLLETLKLRTTIQYLDSRQPLMFQENSSVMAPLTMIEMSDKAVRSVPLLDQTMSQPGWHRWVSFQNWWHGDVLQTSRGKRIDRARLIDRVRSSDGGGHSDPDITHEDYQDARSNLDPRMHWSRNGVSFPITDVHLATLRQIAWELEQSLKDIVIAAPPSTVTKV